MKNYIELLISKLEEIDLESKFDANLLEDQKAIIENEIDCIHTKLRYGLLYQLELLEKWLNKEISNEIYIKFLTDEEFEL